MPVFIGRHFCFYYVCAMELSFALVSELNLTLFDDRVSAAVDEEKGVKIIAKKDMLRFGHDGDSFVPALQVEKEDDVDAAYSLIDNFLDLRDTIVEIEIDIHELGTMGLLVLSHGGRISLIGPHSVEAHMVSEAGEETASISHDYDFIGKWTTIRMFMATPERFVIMLNDKELFWDIPESLSSNVKIQGFLGPMSGTKARFHSIKTYKRSFLDDLLANNGINGPDIEEPIAAESEPIDEAIDAHVIEPTKKLKTAWTQEVMDDLSSYAGAKEEQELAHEVSKAIESYKNTPIEPEKPNTMGETVIEMIARITGLMPEKIAALDHQTLLIQVYNGLERDKAYEGMTHMDLLNTAHSLCSKLIVGERVSFDTKVGLGGKSYRTFEFGDLNDSNCTPEKLLYLVRKYPDVWLKRLV